MPLGFSSGRPLTPLSVATSAFSPAITCRRASFSASSRSASASSSPRGRPERLTCFEADMAETSRVRAGPAQPRQLTSARLFAPRTTLPPLARSGVPAARRLAEEGRDGRDARRRLGGGAGALAGAVPGGGRAERAAALGAFLREGPDPAGRGQERRADGGAGRAGRP